MGEMTIKLQRDRERGNEFHLDEIRLTLIPMYWKLNKTPLGAFNFIHAHWKPSVFHISASFQPLMRFHTSAFTTLSMATS